MLWVLCFMNGVFTLYPRLILYLYYTIEIAKSYSLSVLYGDEDWFIYTINIQALRLMLLLLF